MNDNYHEQQKQENILHLRKLLKEFPPFVSEFFRGIEEKTSSKTRIGYAYDLRIFFNFLITEGKFSYNQIIDLTLQDLNSLTVDDLEEFIEYLSYYSQLDENQNKFLEHKNNEKGKARKISAVRSIYQYFYRKRKLSNNPASLLEMPKIHEKVITRLEPNEVVNLLDEIDSGENLTKKQKDYHQKNRLRDIAIITLLLGTGMRVSECVGIDLADIDFDSNAIKITRKGGNQSILYFGDEVRSALLNYISQRNTLYPKATEENALFLSLQNKRITVRAVQNLVKKYSQLSVKLKNISPHKLRSTYGTNLYRESGDIYLVADALGHKDVNTTRKHYAQMDDDKRRSAVKYIKLRED